MLTRAVCLRLLRRLPLARTELSLAILVAGVPRIAAGLSRWHGLVVVVLMLVAVVVAGAVAAVGMVVSKRGGGRLAALQLTSAARLDLFLSAS